MGKRGPPPKPSKLKKLQGTYRRDRAAPKEMAPPAGAPVRPGWLDAEGKREWDLVVPQLAACGILATIDAAMLADYCAAHSLAVRATKRYQREGLMVADGDRRVKNPLIKVAQEARAQARLLAAEFGLSASSRSRISVPDWKPGGAGASTAKAAPATADQVEDFLFRPKVIDGGKGG